MTNKERTPLKPFWYDGNNLETYTVFFTDTPIMEVRVGEDRCIEIVQVLNDRHEIEPKFFNKLFWDFNQKNKKVEPVQQYEYVLVDMDDESGNDDGVINKKMMSEWEASVRNDYMQGTGSLRRWIRLDK